MQLRGLGIFENVTVSISYFTDTSLRFEEKSQAQCPSSSEPCGAFTAPGRALNQLQGAQVDNQPACASCPEKKGPISLIGHLGILLLIVKLTCLEGPQYLCVALNYTTYTYI